jgi:hypothetical protein
MGSYERFLVQHQLAEVQSHLLVLCVRFPPPVLCPI